MSDTSQGPGWWQAADGKWYAPEQHPDYQPPAAATPPPAAPTPAAPAAPTPPGPMAPPPQMGAPQMGAPIGAPQMGAPQMGAPQMGQPQIVYGAPPAKKSSYKGCLIAFVIVFLVGTAATIGIVVWAGHKVNDAVGINDCPFLSDTDASAALGGNQTVKQFGGLTGLANTVFDDRVLPNAPSCVVTGTGSSVGGSDARVVKYDGGDAATQFTAELNKAKGSGGQSGAVSITSDGYFLKDVTMGDQAFCTTASISAPSSGVLVRKGNTLVYASVLESSDASGNATSDDTNCDSAQKLATKILG